MRRRLLAAALGMLSAVVWSPEAHAANRTVVVDPDSVDSNTSLARGPLGVPVIAYHDSANGRLMLARCNDFDCHGDDESIVAVDSDGDVGSSASLVVDAGGNPVVSYYDATNGYLKVVHCNDWSCTRDDESIVAVDRTGTVGAFTSLVLDAAGKPVVSYYDFGNADLKLVHCNDPNCTGDDESIVTVESTGDVGGYTSLELEAVGNPVVSYHDETNDDLELVHCNDPNCTGDDESIVAVDRTGDVGQHTALALDASGRPVVSYFDATNRDLKVVH